MYGTNIYKPEIIFNYLEKYLFNNCNVKHNMLGYFYPISLVCKTYTGGQVVCKVIPIED